MSFINLCAALKSIEIEANNEEFARTCRHVGKSLDDGTLNLEDAITILSEYTIKFEDAKLLLKYLSKILLALVSTRIPLQSVFSNENFDLSNDSEKTNHLEYSIALSLLSEHPDILQYALKYFEINAVPPYEVFIHHDESYNVAPKKRRLQDCRQKITDKLMVHCCYTLLKKLPNVFATKWDWTNFIVNFIQHADAEVRWIVKECMAILTNMTEIQSKALAQNLNLSKTELFELKNTAKECNKVGKNTNKHVLDGVEISTENVVNLDGIMLPIYNKSNCHSGNLVRVKSTVNNLRSIALAVASGKAISLMGPVGSGKTSLIEHLSSITGRKGVAFKKVQLGDQTDSRLLLGSHQCTDIPGEFVWRPGVLTEAVQNGHWLLLEDIDCAALDVASTLSSLLERNTLCVPGYRDALPVTPGFQLFVTQRTMITNFGFQKKMSNSSALLQKHLTQINVEPLSRAELSEIIETKYPELKTICPRMIEVFMMFSVGNHDSSLHTTQPVSDKIDINVIRGSRLISTRDLLKWCSRAVVDYSVSSPASALRVLQDALDIFTCSVSSPEDRLALSNKVGTCLGIVDTKTEFYCKHYKPNVSLNPSMLEVGRAKVPRFERSLDSIDFDSKQAVFSFTRQSACLLERISCCVMSNEPVLLVGETGTGKTSTVQYLAKQTGHKLVVINMNQQSDSADLLGGYKPVDLKYVIKPIKNEFESLFHGFYNIEKNKKFLNHIQTCYDSESWPTLLTLMKASYKPAINRIASENKDQLLKAWKVFGKKLQKLEQQIKTASRLTFSFIEGSLVKAMQEGHWVLLDEINLASAEILECLAGLLEDKDDTIELLEKGDKVPIKRHPDFTLFACMNPATDVGKKDLPVGLRNRFTEFFIDELTERNDLMLLIGDYLYHMNLGAVILEAIYSFYATIRKEAKLNLVDGSGNTPHYSLRTLCRALTSAARAKCGTVARSLYEAFCLAFLTQLDSSSHPKVEAMIAKAVIGKKSMKSVLNQIIPEPQNRSQNFLLFEGHWIPQGKLDIVIPEGYILTATVRKNLRDIARIISLGKLPVLLQGDTSVGKTSLITYIAKASGNFCVRINNHEHTDLQEYIGSYASDSSGKLVFKEGVLVEAMRKGYWIILDELNLAPSDVLEALNRVLDDNRELFIPETQQVVRADPNFMLFATQNPPGLYGGRKMLSRAFRNRFVELHFDEIPRKELETILHQRCHVPPTYSKKMIAVMAELQVRRRGSAAVQGKDGFITLRDLFRWGQRYRFASKEFLTDDKFYDWDQHIADEGYLILAGKVRQTDERTIIEEVIEKNIKRKVCPDNLFSLHPGTSPVTKVLLETILNYKSVEFSHVVWTFNMRRLAVLIGKSFTFNEPVLLVGETGCGKTTICQVLAALRKRQLLSVNCHMHTESSDFLGGLRPVRHYNNDGRLFEWVDGPLIKAMENGDMFLADEISLADDSVLERMNSLLEPERQLVLTERGMEENSDIVVITADKDFHFIGTMNPGGDFGKKELSPALRNRFTEIWCDSVTSRQDLLAVLERSVSKGISLGNQEDGSSGIGSSILDFTDWIRKSEVTNKFPFSIRDLLSWVQFINVTVAKGLLDATDAYVHGACMTFLDCFGTALTGHIEFETLSLLRKSAINFLLNQIKCSSTETENLRKMLSNSQIKFIAESDNARFGIKPFYIDIGKHLKLTELEQKFTFVAPTTGSNTLRLLRGLQLNKAILLEGNPGVGKTSLVTALAKSSGHKVIRINLSDQTDITDLFGTDLPTEDGSFTFKEGAFLSALQNGDWILLDELNLAPQPVLEGLNACLDHRGEVYIPELGKTFKVKKETRLFACQNPLKQGGARRGLPISFLNRFTQVYIDTLTKEDMIYIVETQFPSLPHDILHKIVEFNSKVAHEITEVQSWGHRGGPWEMNLRDIQRWCEALIKDQDCNYTIAPGKFVDMLYINRMRTAEDKEKMMQTYDQIFGPKYPRSHRNPLPRITDKQISIGDVIIERNIDKYFKNRRTVDTNLLVLRNQLSTLKALAQSVKMNWLSILVGPSSTGKSNVVQVLADLTGNDLQIVPVTSAMDVSDLLGGFEQVDYNRKLENLYDKIETLSIKILRDIWLQRPSKEWKSHKLLHQLHQYKNIHDTKLDNSEEMVQFKAKISFLSEHVKKLIQTVNSQKDDNILTKLQDVLNSLKNLEDKVLKSKAVNAGGKFEWIDALLVKTLIDGSWLLLDNVNLTSAAVLDRLNGLLEPNGVLSIPERGEFSEIIPHPNFRVFFTMDPKYGEISRAMRNRGVEIFLLRPEDWDATLTDTIPYLDLVALLSSTGLSSQYHELSIKCHHLMASYVQGFERPTISHLLQACHLTDQQLIRGISHKTAMINSFSDVYIKPRCGNDFASNIKMSLAEMKNAMFQSLEKLIQEHVYDDFEDVSCEHTLTVAGLCSDSSVEVAEQIAYLPIRQSKAEETSTEQLNLLLSIFIAYQNCPDELLNNIKFLIKNGSVDKSKNNIKLLSCELNEKAQKYIQNNGKSSGMHRRFFPECENGNEIENNTANTKTILLYFELLKCFLTKVLPKSNLTALDYSKAVHSGSLTDDFAEYPILKYCQTYLDLIDRHVESALQTVQDRIDDKKTCDIIQLLNYRSRFVKLASKPIFKVKNEKAVFEEDLVPLLYTHLKWLQKHLIGYLGSLLPQEHNLIEKFNATLKSIMLYDTNDNIELLKIAKKLRKMYGQPKLYQNQTEYELCRTKSDLIKQLSLDLNQPLQKQFFTLTLNNAILLDNSLAIDVPDSSHLIAIKESIANALESPNTKLGIEVALMPINSYILQRVLSLLQGKILEITKLLNANGGINGDLKISTEVVRSVVHYGIKTRTLPLGLQNLMQVILKLLSGDPTINVERLSSMPAKLWDEFYKAITNSPANYPLPFLFVNKQGNNDDFPEEIPSNTKRVSCNLPLMSYYVQKLVISVRDEDQRHVPAYETVSLENREKYFTQLEIVQNILWKSVVMLDKAAQLKIKSDAKFEIEKYEQLNTYLSKIFNNTDYLVALKEHMKNKDSAFVDMFENARRLYDSLKDRNFFTPDKVEAINIKIITAQLSLLTSLLFSRVIAEISPVDHVEKYRLKIKYIDEDVKLFESLLSSYYMHGVVSGTIYEDKDIAFASQVTEETLLTKKEDLKNVHPYCKHIFELKVQTAEKVHKYASGNTFRPEEPSYNTFVKDCRHFTKSVLSAKTVKDLAASLFSASNSLHNTLKLNNLDKTVIINARTVSKETASWLYSVNAFYKKVETNYSEVFPDLAKPLQQSLSQIIASVTGLNDLLRELIAKLEQGLSVDFVSHFLNYPNNFLHPFDWDCLNKYNSTEIEQSLKKNIIVSTADTFSVDLEHIELLKMNLLELKMYSIAMEKSDKVIFNGVLKTLNDIVKAWEKQQRDIEKKKEDDEALYVTKSKCEDEDEEAMDKEQILEMFPTYTDHDFAEFKPTDLEEKSNKLNPKKEKPKLLITADDVSLVYKWHSDYIRNVTSAEWLPIQKKIATQDVVSPFLARYPIFSRVIDNSWDALDAESEFTMNPGLLVLLAQIKAKVDGDESHGKTDFYKSPWVSETKQCVPLMKRVKDSTNELLELWPDFPTLKDIIVIVDRILSFSVTSPVSRFLTGLELLRDKIEEWNKNAHKGNNLIDVSLAVGQQIINWRKLEMGHWKECLNNVFSRKQSEAHKYWFYLYSVVNSYLYPENSEEPVSPERVITVLKDFMESSNLAEYEIRLDIVYVYHCHLVHFEAESRRDELISVLWNTYNYYSQFLPQVTTQIKEKRAPIEKKLKDFVKICTWDRDLSYWSVKDTVEKAHKALHKHVKEFERVLKEPASPYLLDNKGEIQEHVGIWDRPKRATGASAAPGGAYMLDVQNYIVLARNVKKYLDQAEVPCSSINEGSLLSKVPSLLNKAKALCKDTINNTGYPSLVQALDDFVTSVIENSTHLGSLDVDASAEKEKQKSQAKNIVQQKRKALADLFKYLSKMGLNYRTGLVLLNSESELYDFTIAPVDLDAAMSYLKSRRCDTSLGLLWSGCETYFQKNITRHRFLTAALQNPHQDLGVQNIERCKGFAAQLLKTTNIQKKSISKYSRSLCELRNLTTSLTNALEVDPNSTNVFTLNEKLNSLNMCYAQINLVLEQFKILLKSLPARSTPRDFEPEFDVLLTNSPIVRCYKNSEEWKDLYSAVNKILVGVNKHKTAVNKLLNTLPKQIGKNYDVPVISQTHIEVTNEAKKHLEKLNFDIYELILDKYQLKDLLVCLDDDYVPQHPILARIVHLTDHLINNIGKLDTLEKHIDEEMDCKGADQIITESEDLIATMLLIIQSIYKKHLSEEKSSENLDVLDAIDEIIKEDSTEEKESKEILEDGHLKVHLQEKLTNDTRMLQVEILLNKMRRLLISYVEYAATTKDVASVKNAVMRTVPILEQTILFVQYFIAQKVAVHRVSCKMLSVLLKIFSDLATKGFCKPSDIDMDGEGEDGPGKLSSGTGLGEGEGQKDVSEQIENQDQLDDAQKPGEEKKEEERDCKEEEKGVNMTDDFDSHLQDVEKKDGEDSDKEDEEDDADKQMGDTDNAAEKLDQQIWGSEDEEDIDEENKKDKEEKGTGESTGEKEMGAKDEEQGKDDGAEGKDKKEKKDINEVNEPEVDDDHVDPYHGNHEPLPEPEDFALPDNMDVDGDESDQQDGETETENPFELDVTKENIPEENEEGKDENEEESVDNRNGLDVSSDEDDGGEDENAEGNDKDNEENKPEEQPDQTDEKDQNEKEDENGSAEPDSTEQDAETPEAPDDKEPEENLPKNDDKIDEDDTVEQKEHEANPQANPSNDDASAEDKAENAQMDRGADDNVETNEQQQKDEDAAPYEQAQEQVGEDKQSTGRSELDKSDKGHRGEKQAASRSEPNRQERNKFENKPGKTDEERTLGEVNEKAKKTKTVNVENQEESVEDGGDGEDHEEKEADAYEHVKQAKKDDLQAIDAATKEQADQQPTVNKEEEDAEELKEDEQVPMEVDDEELKVEKSEELKPEKTQSGQDKEKDKSGNNKESGDEPTGETAVEVEGDIIQTVNVPRGIDTSYHTNLTDTQHQSENISVEQYLSIREWITSKSHAPGTASTVWRSLWQQSGSASRALCERLRLVLEPTARSRKAGDFRTGRAINMRRVIPYIASQFRKDRIWLRRTKPAKREYKIAIAMDDSSSMADNRSKELAFESLALVSQALNLLESGDLAVLSFGEKPNLLHPFTEQFSEHSGSKILEQLRFDQTKTKIAQLLDFCTVLFEDLTIRSDVLNAKLLIIVSDGRGIFSEGETKVLHSVRRARQQGVFLVYVIIDNPDNKDSIMDIRRPLLDPATNTLTGFVPYLDTFPFPFYLILRDMAALPTVLGDALRQWFELAANNTS